MITPSYKCPGKDLHIFIHESLGQQRLAKEKVYYQHKDIEINKCLPNVDSLNQTQTLSSEVNCRYLFNQSTLVLKLCKESNNTGHNLPVCPGIKPANDRLYLSS